jgi:hypothetical protein
MPAPHADAPLKERPAHCLLVDVALDRDLAQQPPGFVQPDSLVDVGLTKARWPSDRDAGPVQQLLDGRAAHPVAQRQLRRRRAGFISPDELVNAT